MTPTEASGDRPSLHSRAMPMLRCRFGATDYLLPLDRIVEIVRYVRPTPVPEVAPWIAGVMNLRGRIHPVIDLAIKLADPPTEVDEETCIVLVHGPARDAGAPLGLISGRVTTIHDLKRGDLDPPRRLTGRLRAEFIEGSFRTAEGIALVLNLERVLSTDHVLDGGGTTATPASTAEGA